MDEKTTDIFIEMSR
jgi:hypothetical protein